MYSSMDYWFSIAVLGNQNPSFINSMYEALAAETPRILSVVGERSCNLQCSHCIFQKEKSSATISQQSSLQIAALTIVRQMGSRPMIVHEGRIFQPSHLEWLSAVRATRPDSRIGIIENGTYLQYADEIESSGFKFDWIDISLDGPKSVHNKQRCSDTSFDQSLKGLEQATRFLRPGGRVSSLFTLTRINFASLLDTAQTLPVEVQEWHITTISPVRPEIQHLATSHEEFGISWSQIVKARKLRPLVLRIYVIEDVLKLAKAVGRRKLLTSLHEAKVDLASICFDLDGVRVIYYPQSVCTSETFVLDADAHYRVPYSVAYTLEELQRGVSRFREGLARYTVAKVNKFSNFRSLYRRCVASWKNEFGLAALQKERSVFNLIHKLP